MITEDRISEPVDLPVNDQVKVKSRPVGIRILFWILSILGFFAFVAVVMGMLFIVIPDGPEIAISRKSGTDSLSLAKNIPLDTVKIRREIALLEKRIDKLTSQGPYLIVNTTQNRFYLYSGNQLIRQGPCSTGSNTKLVKGNQEWKFKTPRGVHRVESKAKNPVWAKPNWAFIEEGLPIPPRDHPSRFDPYTLGDYKVEIGDDYMIHGTLYKRLIGMPVTHGCIRMLDEDIEAVYKTLPIGAKVIIY
jgi:L,D-transpeptidase YbiS